MTTSARLSAATIRDGLKAISVATVVLMGGLTWAMMGVVAAALLDGVPADDYDAGNRAAFGIAFLALGALCPTACGLTYSIARRRGHSFVRSMLLAQLVSAVLAAEFMAMWLS